MLDNIFTSKCKHHNECRYVDTEKGSVCMTGGGNYCGAYREWTTRLEAHLH